MTRSTLHLLPFALVLLSCSLPATEAAAPAASSSKDVHGDDLPAGAVARGGTVRFRHASSAIAVSPDGKILASGGHDNQIRLFDAATGKELRRLAGHQARTYVPEFDPRSPLDTLVSVVGSGFVCSLAFSPDGKTLASGGWDDCVRLWDVETGKQVRKIDAHKAMVTKVAFSPDGKVLASRGGLDGMAKLWDPQTGTQLHKFTGLSAINPWRFNHDSALAFAPDSKTVAVTARGSIVTYDTASGAERRRFDAHSYGICLAYSPDGKTLASGGVDPGKDVYSLRLWDPVSGKELRRCTLPKNEPPTYLAFQPKRNDRLAAVVAEDDAHVFDVTTGKEVFTIKHYWPSRAAYSPDGKVIATAGSGPVVRHWDAENGKELFLEYDGHQSGVRAVSLSKDGKVAASAGDLVRVWEPASGKSKQKIRVPGGAAAVAVAPDGKTVASAGRDRVIRIHDAENGKPVKELKGHKHALLALAFSPDGKKLASGDVQSTLRIWDVESGKDEHAMEYKAGTEAMSLAFSPNGKTLACAGAWNDSSFLPKPGSTITINGKQIKLNGPIVIQGVEMTRREGYRVLLFDANSGKEVRHCAGLNDKIDSVAFSPDGATVAAASRDGKVCLWEQATGKLRLAINAHPSQTESAATAVAFVSDKTLATASADSTLRTWDASTGQELRQYRAAGPLTCLTAGRDAKTVVTGGSDTAVLFWDVTLPAPQRRKGNNVITLR
jgi:WD40 repeat protein